MAHEYLGSHYLQCVAGCVLSPCQRCACPRRKDVNPVVACRAPAYLCAASTGLPFLDGLSEEQAPAIFALRREHEAFKTMRQVQKEILTTIAQRLSIHPVPTTVSDDGLAYFTTPDKQTSIALQVGTDTWCILCNVRPICTLSITHRPRAESAY